MANVEINDLALKATPVSTDELELQETGGGASKKATLGTLPDNVHARCKSVGGVLQSGDVGVASVSNATTGQYDYTLDTAITATATAQVFACGEGVGGEITAYMTSTSVCRVECTIAGVATDMSNSLLIYDEA